MCHVCHVLRLCTICCAAPGSSIHRGTFTGAGADAASAAAFLDEIRSVAEVVFRNSPCFNKVMPLMTAMSLRGSD